MAAYSVGIATKARIFQTSKRLFYDQGVKETSFTQISKLTSVNRGVITYHFKNKANIVIEVYHDFITAIDKALDEQWGSDARYTKPVRNIVYEYLMFRLLRENRNVCRFYSEVLSSPECHEACTQMQLEVMGELEEGAGVTLPKESLRAIAVMLNGTESELVQAVYDGTLTESVEDFVHRDIRVCYFMLDVPMGEVEQWWQESMNLARGLTLTCDADFNVRVVEVSSVES